MIQHACNHCGVVIQRGDDVVIIPQATRHQVWGDINREPVVVLDIALHHRCWQSYFFPLGRL